MWDAETGATHFVLEGHRSVVDVAFSADGSRIVTYRRRDVVNVWDARSGAKLLAIKVHPYHSPYAASFSADGSRIVVIEGREPPADSWQPEPTTAKVWNATTGVELMTLQSQIKSVDSALFNADDSRIILTGDSKVEVWDTKTWKVVLTIKSPIRRLSGASMSRDGSRIITHSDGAFTLWDAATGAELFTLQGHHGSVGSASFSADGLQIVTSSWSDCAKVWDARPWNHEVRPWGPREAPEPRVVEP
jgi:WD40 repeat protein